MALSWMENLTDNDRLLLKHQIKSAVSGVGITTSALCKCNLTNIACGRWRLVTDKGEVSRLSSCAVEVLEPCLNNSNNKHR